MEGVQLALPLDYYREGADPNPTPAPEVRNRVYDLLRDVGAPESMAGLVGRWMEYLKNDPEAKLRSTLADAAGISYSMALERWGTPDDIAAALATSLLRAEDHEARCQRCGTKPEEWTHWITSEADGVTRLLREKDEPPYKFELHDCYGCDGIYHRDLALNAEERAAGKHWVIKQRQPGEGHDSGF